MKRSNEDGMNQIGFLEAKEGLALINGTQAMTAIGGLALAKAINLCKVACTCVVKTFEH